MKKHLKEAIALVERGLDKNVRVCVTGLSGSGKTAFITSIVNQLLHHKTSNKLPFWLAHAEERILAVKVIPYQDLHIPEFPYEESLKLIEEQLQWPDSTRNISQIRISIKYLIENKWIRKLQTSSYLNLDIVDYPGEWLLDLPMLNMNYEQWCRSYFDWLQHSPQASRAESWLENLNRLDIANVANEIEIKNLSQQFRDFLIDCKKSNDGIHYIQPGRFVLPGDLDGAPVLDFFPVKISDAHTINSHSNFSQLEQRFNYYRDQVVKPFFKEYFSKVDRQLLLVDCLKVLNQGYDSYKELQQTLGKIITSFNYGQSNWFKRMFQPKINKLIIAASKSDHVPPDQQNHLKKFLANMLLHAENQVGYQGVDVSNLVFSAISTTQAVAAEHNKQQLTCVKGIEASTGKEIVNYPGKIPIEPMSKQQWQQQQFNFVDFAIPDLAANQQLPHQRMDQLIEQLIGDKFL